MSVSSSEIKTFSREFAAQIDAGQSIVRALATLEAKQPNPDFQRILAEINRDVQAGSNLSRAMSRYPDVFDLAYVGTVRQGETGDLKAALRQLV